MAVRVLHKILKCLVLLSNIVIFYLATDVNKLCKKKIHRLLKRTVIIVYFRLICY